MINKNNLLNNEQVAFQLLYFIGYLIIAQFNIQTNNFLIQAQCKELL